MLEECFRAHGMLLPHRYASGLCTSHPPCCTMTQAMVCNKLEGP